MKKNIHSLSLDKLFLICSIIFLLAVMVPLLIIAQYNIPAVDDYSYSALTHKIYEETGSVFQTIGTAFKQACITYEEWQGSFTAVFLMALQPGIWGEGTYSVTTFIVLGIFLLGNFSFCYVVFGRFCKASPSLYISIFAVITSLSILWCPDPVSSYYWYNGSVYYTFFYGIMLILLSALMNSFLTVKTPKWYSFLLTIAGSVFLGGGNYVTGLFFAEIMVLLVLYAYLKKKKNRTYLLVSFSTFLIAFVINMLAPGNAVRAQGNESMNALGSIWESLKAGQDFLVKPTNIMVILGLLLIVPLLWRILEKVNYSFKYPVVVTLLSFGLFSSQFTPTLFAQSFIGPARIQNIIWYSLWVFLLINIMYWFGWIKNTVNGRLTNNTIHSIITDAFGKKIVFYYLMICIIYFMFMFDYGFMNTSSVSAIISLRNGEAEIYYNEYLEREYLISVNKPEDVVVSSFTSKPHLLFFDDISTDTTDWRNLATADYYQINTIRIDEN